MASSRSLTDRAAKSRAKENGAGKSTILDALCFGLFNKPFRNISKNQLINSEEVFSRSQSIAGVRAGALKSGWSRMVFDLARPMSVDSAGVTVAPETAQAELIIRLTKTDEDRFAAAAKKPAAQQTVVTTPRDASNADQFVVVLDPGHGGIDPGAVVGEAHEADLMLSLARERSI